MAISELKPYSLGIVAENKKLRGADGKFNYVVEVTPIEDVPMIDGEITSKIIDEKVQSQDSDGNAYEVKVNSANSIAATWLPLGGSNRVTAPDVRRGTVVMLWRFSDEDKFFWVTLKDDLALRKLETVVYAWSGTKKEGADVNADNYYYLEVSTHRGVVHFHTSKANGEFCAYDIQINTKDGVIQISDDVGNSFFFNSKEHQLSMKNADDCYMDLNKKNLTINVPETFAVYAKNVVHKIDQSIVTQASNIATTASKGIHQQGADVVVHGSASVAVTSPATTIV